MCVTIIKLSPIHLLLAPVSLSNGSVSALWRSKFRYINSRTLLAFLELAVVGRDGRDRALGWLARGQRSYVQLNDKVAWPGQEKAVSGRFCGRSRDVP